MNTIVVRVLLWRRLRMIYTLRQQLLVDSVLYVRPTSCSTSTRVQVFLEEYTCASPGRVEVLLLLLLLLLYGSLLQRGAKHIIPVLIRCIYRVVRTRYELTAVFCIWYRSSSCRVQQPASFSMTGTSAPCLDGIDNPYLMYTLLIVLYSYDTYEEQSWIWQGVCTRYSSTREYLEVYCRLTIYWLLSHQPQQQIKEIRSYVAQR